MLAASLPSHEHFRSAFVSSFTKHTHLQRIKGQRWENIFNHVCAHESVIDILKRETAKHHQIGSTTSKNQNYGDYNHMGLIDAACTGANVASYTQQKEAINRQKETINQLEQRVHELQHEQQQQQETHTARILVLQQQNDDLNNKNKNQKIQFDTELATQLQQSRIHYETIIEQCKNQIQTLESVRFQLIQQVGHFQQSNIQLSQSMQLQTQQLRAQLQSQYQNQLHKINCNYNQQINQLKQTINTLQVRIANNDFNCNEIQRLQMENSQLRTTIDKYEKDLLNNLINNDKSKESKAKHGTKRSFNGTGNDPQCKRRRLTVKTKTEKQTTKIDINNKFLYKYKLQSVCKITQRTKKNGGGYTITFVGSAIDPKIPKRDLKISHKDENALFVGDVVCYQNVNYTIVDIVNDTEIKMKVGSGGDIISVNPQTHTIKTISVENRRVKNITNRSLKKARENSDMSGEQIAVASMYGSNSTKVQNPIEKHSRPNTMQKHAEMIRQTKINASNRRALVGLVLELDQGRERRIKTNVSFQTIVQNHPDAESWGLSNQHGLMTLPCDRTVQEEIQRTIQELDFKCSMSELMQQMNVQVPAKLGFKIVGGFLDYPKRVRLNVEKSINSYFKQGTFWPSMKDHIKETASGQKHLEYPFQFFQADGFGIKNIDVKDLGKTCISYGIRSPMSIAGYSQSPHRVDSFGYCIASERDEFESPVLHYISTCVKQLTESGGLDMFVDCVGANVLIELKGIEACDKSLAGHIIGGQSASADYFDHFFNGAKRHDPQSWIEITKSTKILRSYRITEKTGLFRNEISRQYHINNRSKPDNQPFRNFCISEKIYVSIKPSTKNIEQNEYANHKYQINSIPNSIKPEDMTYIPPKTLVELKNVCLRGTKAKQITIPLKFKSNGAKLTLRVEFNQRNRNENSNSLINNDQIDYSLWKFYSKSTVSNSWTLHFHCIDGGHSMYHFCFAIFLAYIVCEILHTVMNWINFVMIRVLGFIVIVGERLKQIQFWDEISSIFKLHGLIKIANQLESKSAKIDLEKVKPTGNDIETSVVNFASIITHIIATDAEITRSELFMLHGFKQIAIMSSDLCVTYMKTDSVTQTERDEIWKKAIGLLRFTADAAYFTIKLKEMFPDLDMGLRRLCAEAIEHKHQVMLGQIIMMAATMLAADAYRKFLARLDIISYSKDILRNSKADRQKSNKNTVKQTETSQVRKSHAKRPKGLWRRDSIVTTTVAVRNFCTNGCLRAVQHRGRCKHCQNNKHAHYCKNLCGNVAQKKKLCENCQASNDTVQYCCNGCGEKTNHKNSLCIKCSHLYFCEKCKTGMKSPGKCGDCRHKDFDVFERLIESLLTENKVTDEFKLLLNEVSQIKTQIERNVDKMKKHTKKIQQEKSRNQT